jgi:polyketide biosynthesis acyl carrier protein
MKSEEIMPLIHESIIEVLPELQDHDFQDTESLDGLGANSMDRAEIVMTVLERMNLQIPLVETFGPRDLGELARHLSEQSAVAQQRA